MIKTQKTTHISSPPSDPACSPSTALHTVTSDPSLTSSTGSGQSSWGHRCGYTGNLFLQPCLFVSPWERTDRRLIVRLINHRHQWGDERASDLEHTITPNSVQLCPHRNTDREIQYQNWSTGTMMILSGKAFMRSINVVVANGINLRLQTSLKYGHDVSCGNSSQLRVFFAKDEAVLSSTTIWD